jgi:drug/metabolite transporter (DMT)-like permease
MNPTIVAALLVSSALAATGQVFLKLGVGGLAGPIEWVNGRTLFGLFLYAAGLALWLYGLSRAPLHLVYPFAILTFVLVGIVGMIALGERPTTLTLAGWGVICVGLALVQLGALSS